MATPLIIPDTLGEDAEPIKRLERDVKEASYGLGAAEARYLVELYYTMQRQRITLSAQVTAAEAAEEPNRTITYFGQQSLATERQIATVLGYYAQAQPLGEWALGITGIGPILAAGLLAHIDIPRNTTAGQIWSFAGLNPTAVWGEGQKRPWNAKLKVLCYKIGESFIKSSGSEKSYYGPRYKARRAYEWKRNLGLELTEQAAVGAKRKFRDDEGGAKLWYSGCYRPEEIHLEADAPFTGLKKHEPDPRFGMLPPAHIYARTRRWVEKLFLAHYFEVGYALHFGKRAPVPFPIAHLGHVDYDRPPTIPEEVKHLWT